MGNFVFYNFSAQKKGLLCEDNTTDTNRTIYSVNCNHCTSKLEFKDKIKGLNKNEKNLPKRTSLSNKDIYNFVTTKFNSSKSLLPLKCISKSAKNPEIIVNYFNKTKTNLEIDNRKTPLPISNVNKSNTMIQYKKII